MCPRPGATARGVGVGRRGNWFRDGVRKLAEVNLRGFWRWSFVIAGPKMILARR